MIAIIQYFLFWTRYSHYSLNMYYRKFSTTKNRLYRYQRSHYLFSLLQTFALSLISFLLRTHTHTHCLFFILNAPNFIRRCWLVVLLATSLESRRSARFTGELRTTAVFWRQRRPACSKDRLSPHDRQPRLLRRSHTWTWYPKPLKGCQRKPCTSMEVICYIQQTVHKKLLII